MFIYVLLYFNGCCGDEVHYIGDKEGLKKYCKDGNINISKLEPNLTLINGDYKAYTVSNNMDYTILIKYYKNLKYADLLKQFKRGDK